MVISTDAFPNRCLFVRARGVDAEGGFRIYVDPGIYAVRVAAVDHAMLWETIYVDKALEIRGTLGTYERSQPGDTLKLKTELLDANGNTLSAQALVAEQKRENLYRLDLSTKPAGAVTLRYQLEGLGGRTFNGPLADTYHYDGDGDFWSVVDIGTPTTLELDLAKLPPSGKAPEFAWIGEVPELIALRAYRSRWGLHIRQLRDKLPTKDDNLYIGDATYKQEMASFGKDALAEAHAAETEQAHMFLRLAQLELFGFSADEAVRREQAQWLFERVEPGEPRLGIINLNAVLGRVLSGSDTTLAKHADGWIERMAEENPDPFTALLALSSLIIRADERGDHARVAELYGRLGEPRFAELEMRKYLMSKFDPNRIWQRGKPFPSYEFTALEASDSPISHIQRKGQLYLLEFWATWCVVCIKNMPNLHAAYAKLNEIPARGGEKVLRRLRSAKKPKVEFVFVSLDQNPDDVETFRRKYWSMPWTHAFVGQQREKETMERYGFGAVPAAVLIDGSGTIVALDEALRGDRLLPTLVSAYSSAR